MRFSIFLHALALVLLIAAAALVPPWKRPDVPKPAPRAFGVAVGYGLGGVRELDQLGPVWYTDFDFRGAVFGAHQRLYLVESKSDWANLPDIARQHRGEWWQFGNEPNDPNQDNLSPAEYAARYHDFYFALKAADATASIIPAGVANADWRWADAFREAYRARFGRYPRVDGWSIHNYLLDRCGDALDVNRFQARVLASVQQIVVDAPAIDARVATKPRAVRFSKRVRPTPVRIRNARGNDRRRRVRGFERKVEIVIARGVLRGRQIVLIRIVRLVAKLPPLAAMLPRDVWQICPVRFGCDEVQSLMRAQRRAAKIEIGVPHLTELIEFARAAQPVANRNAERARRGFGHIGSLPRRHERGERDQESEREGAEENRESHARNSASIFPRIFANFRE